MSKNIEDLDVFSGHVRGIDGSGEYVDKGMSFRQVWSIGTPRGPRHEPRPESPPSLITGQVDLTRLRDAVGRFTLVGTEAALDETQLFEPVEGLLHASRRPCDAFCNGARSQDLERFRNRVAAEHRGLELVELDRVDDSDRRLAGSAPVHPDPAYGADPHDPGPAHGFSPKRHDRGS